MIDLRSQYIIYKEQEIRLMLRIERYLVAQERVDCAETSQRWYSTVEQWLEEKVFSRRPAKRPCIAEESPC